MPTLVRVDVPADDSRGNDSSSVDLDETTLSLRTEPSLHKSKEKMNDLQDDSNLVDKSINMLLYDSASSSNNGMDDSVVSSDTSFNRSRRSRSNHGRHNSNDRQDENNCHISRKVEIKNFRNDHSSRDTCNNYSNDDIRLSNDDSRLSNSMLCNDNDETRLSNLHDETKLSDSDSDSQSSKSANLERRKTKQQSSQSGFRRGTRSNPRSQEIEKERKAKRHPKPTKNRPVAWCHQKECDEFQAKFKERVIDFEQRNPQVKLRDYNSMAPEEQRVEQNRVVKLLSRLGIRDMSPNRRIDESIVLSPGARIEGNSIMPPADESMTRIDDSPSFHSPKNNSSFDSLVANTPFSTTETQERTGGSQTKDRKVAATRHEKQNHLNLSSVGLSPISGASPKTMALENASHLKFTAETPIREGASPLSLRPVDSDSDRSVEITRGGAISSSSSSPIYQSPELQMNHRSRSNASKRLASTSGKRGNDMVRTKLSRDLSSYLSEDEGMPPPAQDWSSSDDSFSMVSSEKPQCRPFSASRSPIQESRTNKGGRRERMQSSSQEDRHSRSRYNDTSRPSHQRRREYEDSPGVKDDTVDSFDITMYRNQQGRGRLREISSNIALKDGVPFHYNPLHIKRSKRTKPKERTRRDHPLHRQVDFRDPLGAYFGQEAEDLHHIYEWLHDRDNIVSHGDADDFAAKWNSNSRGIIFSLTRQQIASVVIKLLLESDRESLREDRFTDDSSLSGETLIVVRSKDDIAFWERCLREFTSFSVISHGDLPCSERKRSATASKCATFDVVISTFDALKSQDITTQLDDDGHAVTRQSAESQSNGWMMKRSSSQSQFVASQRIAPAVQCKQLSIFHRVQWRRVIFTDQLGRKTYTAKAGTQRLVAAKALSGNARFIFFTNTTEESDHSAFESLHRSDKRSIEAVASVLRIEIDDEDENLLDVIIDPAQGL